MKWLNGVSCDRRLRLIWLVIFIVALGAFGLRAPRLRMRPMHTDEAVHAYNFRGLLEDGIYKYDPHEYHGPTLNYFTLIPAWLSASHKYNEITEFTVRIVPVVFGVVLILLAVLLADGLGVAAIVAAVLAALSPALVFYSRYYIQETLLVCFTFGVIVCGYRYVRSRRLSWAILAGVFAGLMHATKETAVIAFGAMILALVAVVLIGRRQGRVSIEVKPSHVILGLAAAVMVSALFYSAFGRNPRGVLDSYLTYTGYLGRGAGQNTAHVHPWSYYLQMLLWARYSHGPIWTEGGIVLFALVGIAAAVKGSGIGPLDPKLVRFLAIYTVAMTVAYSAVPYKTPWCVLSFLHSMILLAGVGAVVLLTWLHRPAVRLTVVVALFVAAGHLAFETYRANFVYYADSRNPYVYAHATPEIFTAVEKVHEYAAASDVGHSDEMPVQVIVPGGDYWPLPWYLRDLRVGYYADVPQAGEIGPLILIADTLEGTLARRLYSEMPAEKRQMYMYLFDAPYYIWARPQVKLMGFVRKDIWERHTYGTSDATQLLGEKNGK